MTESELRSIRFSLANLIYELNSTRGSSLEMDLAFEAVITYSQTALEEIDRELEVFEYSVDLEDAETE